MPVTVQCPDCRTTLATRTTLLGRRGQCAGCGLVFLLASPVGQRLVDDEVDSPQMIEELPILPAEPETPPSPVASPAQQPQRKKPSRREKQERRRGAPWALVVLLAFGFLVVCSAVVFLTGPRNGTPLLLWPEGGQPDGGRAKGGPPEAAAPTPVPIPRARPATIGFESPVAELYASGGGRYVVFHLSEQAQLVIYDTANANRIGTVDRVEPGSQIAVGRSKMFVGSLRDVSLARYDLRTATREDVIKPLFCERIGHMSVGAAPDGPLVMGATTPERKFQVRLYDAETFAPVEAPIDDPTLPGEARRFPLPMGIGPTHIAVSADGRSIAFGDRLYSRKVGGYRAVPIDPWNSFRPSPDGTVLLGRSLVGEDGRVLHPDDQRTRFLPATDGPFFLSVESSRPRPVQLLLHADQDPKPLGELPVSEELLNWFSTGGSHVFLHRHLAFLPEPGLVVFAAPRSRVARFLPVDLPALLSKAGRDVTFTSVPPVAVPKDGRYFYAATAVTKDGMRPTYRLVAGPPGMSITDDGLLTWSANFFFREATADVHLVAIAPGGKKANQQFRLFLPDW